MKIDFKNLILLLAALGLVACGSANSSKSGALNSSSMGGVHVGNPIDGGVSSVSSNTYSSPGGFDIPVRSDQTLKLAPKNELLIQTPKGDELSVRVVDAERGPRTLEDFTEFLSSLPNSNQFDVVETPGNSRLAIRKLAAENLSIEERVVFSPNKKILWIRAQTDEKTKDSFQNNIDRISYDLTAPVIDSPSIDYDSTDRVLSMMAKVSKNHPQHEVRVQIWLENSAEPLVSIDRLVVAQLALGVPPKEDKLPSKTRVGKTTLALKTADYRVSHMIVWDPIGNRRVFIAPPFGNFYQMTVIPISKDESERSNFEPTQQRIMQLDLQPR